MNTTPINEYEQCLQAPALGYTLSLMCVPGPLSVSCKGQLVVYVSHPDENSGWAVSETLQSGLSLYDHDGVSVYKIQVFFHTGRRKTEKNDSTGGSFTTYAWEKTII